MKSKEVAFKIAASLGDIFEITLYSLIEYRAILLVRFESKPKDIFVSLSTFLNKK